MKVLCFLVYGESMVRRARIWIFYLKKGNFFKQIQYTIWLDLIWIITYYIGLFYFLKQYLI